MAALQLQFSKCKKKQLESFKTDESAALKLWLQVTTKLENMQLKTKLLRLQQNLRTVLHFITDVNMALLKE
jgi:hypothetical protein